MKEKLQLRHSRDFGEIISDSIVFLAQNWKTLFKTYFIFCGFFMAGNMIFSILLQLKIVTLHNDTINTFRGSRAASFGIEYFMVLLFSFLNVVSITITSLCYITLYNEKGNIPPTTEEVWGYFKYYFWRVTGSILLLGLIIFVALMICMIPVYFFIVSFGQAIGGFIAVFLLLLPLCYFLTILGMFFPIMIVENSGFGYAFSKSFKLIKGNWWRTFGVFFVIAIIMYALYILILIPFGILSGGTVTFISYNVSFWVVILYCIVISLAQIINLLPQTAAAIAYFSYAEDKESIGLMERIDTLGSTTDDLDPAPDEY
jgi:hypothetical protein